MTESERLDAKKAMAFDLFQIVDKKPEQTSYTPEEVKKLIAVYVETVCQQ